MLIKNGNVFLDGHIEKCDVEISETVTAIGDLSGSSHENDILDASGLYVFPGFVDIHTHGGGGGDFMDACEESFDRALRFHAKSGTTSVVVTSVTADPSDICRMLALTKKYMDRQDCSNGARVLGAHIEGPYLSLKNKGAQHEKHLRVPAVDSYDFILDAADVIKTVTIAPELDGAVEMTREMVSRGIVVCGGHDDGCYEKVLPVIEAGLKHCTHLWCAMSTVHMRNGRRSAGLCEVGLLSDKLSVEVIADNHHISPEMIRLIYKCKGSDKMCLVSDCLRAGGMPEGKRLYKLGQGSDPDAMDFIVADGVAKLPDGSRFAGSIQPISQMLRNVVFDAGIPLEEAVKMVTSTSADIINEKSIGRIACGNKADFCIMDRNLVPFMTIVNGKIIYRKENNS